MRRLALLFCLAVSLVFAASAAAAPPSPGNEAGHEILGVVPVHGQAGKPGGSGSNLTYHFGPVMTTNQTYAIYWDPAGTTSGSYQTTINGFLGDVALDSGKTGNVYYSDTQYSSIAYSSSYVASFVDATSYPTNGCSDSYTTTCLSDGQITTELRSFVSSHGLPTGGSTLYFVFTPRGVGSCYSSGSCAFSSYCAYHSNVGTGSSAIIYANQPYTMTVPAACGSGQSPNGNDADSTINVVSHEHNESITDPFGTAWYDRRGYENGDKCAWNFGTALGTNANGRYNQLINGHDYYLQQEWSNSRSGCVLTGIQPAGRTLRAA